MSHMWIMTVGMVIMTVCFVSVGSVGGGDGLAHMLLRENSIKTTGDALVSA